jgi:hypothetical protein
VRRRAQLALAGLAAGATLLTAGTTAATYTDSASVSARAGAGSLDVTVDQSGGLALVPGAPTPSRLPVTTSADWPATLSVSVVGRPGADPCAGLPAATLTVRTAGGTPVSRTLCTLVTEPARVLTRGVAATGVPAELQLHVDVPAAATGPAWTGTLRLTLGSPPGSGFTDHADVPLTVAATPDR